MLFKRVEQVITQSNYIKLMLKKLPKNNKLFQFGSTLIIINILLVLLATLYPFNFSFKYASHPLEIIQSFNHVTDATDQIKNVLLFMPLGFGITCLLESGKKLKWTSKIVIVLLVSAGFSLTVEFLQILLPSRRPTPADIINNSTGGILGFICFYIWKQQILKAIFTRIENSKIRPSIKNLSAVFVTYLSLIFIIYIAFNSTVNLSNWDVNFPLVLGRDLTEYRPWKGYISQVHMTDKAISKDEVARVFSDENYFTNLGDSLLASYQFTGKGAFQDQTGQLPDLIWRGKPSPTQNEKGVFLSNEYSLKSASPATFLSKRIRKTSEFTLSTTVATADPDQDTFGRIVSLSGKDSYRNFLLAQDDAHLIFLLRTPLTGEKAGQRSLVITDCFADTNPHHLVITYSSPVIQIYVDNLQNLHSLNLLESLSDQDKILYYGLAFIPLGLCLSLLITFAKRRLIFYNLLLVSGIFLPSLILEGILASESSRNIIWKNLFLGILFTGGTVLVLKVWLSFKLKR